MFRRDLAWWLNAARALLALLAALGVISIGAGNPGGLTTDTQTVPVAMPVATAPAATAVDGPDADTKRDDALVLDQTAKDLNEAASSPAGSTAEELDGDGVPLRGDDNTEAGILAGPLATQEWPGCRTAFVRNFSSRAGVTPRVIFWHQTVSRENGWSSQNALTALANNASAQVSWHFLIGRSDGLCTYTVPTAYKAWTQGNANPFGIGIEVEAYGDESTYVTGAGKARLLEVTRRLGRQFDIPMQRGIVRECRVVQPGIVEHKDADQATTCAGGHADVNLPGTNELIRELAKPACGRRCHTAKRLRARHARTHQLHRKNHCRRKHAVENGYCEKLRKRNKAIHRAARKAHIRL